MHRHPGSACQVRVTPSPAARGFAFCVYVCVCVCICVYVCMYVCMYVCIYVCMCVCMYVVCVFVCTYVCVWMYVCLVSKASETLYRCNKSTGSIDPHIFVFAWWSTPSPYSIEQNPLVYRTLPTSKFVTPLN